MKINLKQLNNVIPHLLNLVNKHPGNFLLNINNIIFYDNLQ